jgi:hypothetical protein
MPRRWSYEDCAGALTFFCFSRTCGPGFCALSNSQTLKLSKDGAVALKCFLVLEGACLASVQCQMLHKRRESNKDGAFTLTCFLLLQDTWSRILYTLKCCAGAESLTKMALSNSPVFCLNIRTRGPGFCTLSIATQRRESNKDGPFTLTCSFFCRTRGPGFCALPMLRRRRESAKIHC